jgi:hypothetical protein
MTEAQLILKDVEIGEVLLWDKVSEIHKTRHGIYQQNGKLISLLTDFGKINPCYPDFTGNSADEIFYTGAGRRGDQKLDIWNQAMLSAIEAKLKVPLFCKLKVNKWQFTGFWRVSEGEYIFDDFRERMIWKFRLKRENSASED